MLRQGGKMKKLISVLLAAVLLGTPCAFAESPDILRDGDIPVSAPSAILTEKSTGQVLYEKNADEALPPASVTKVMTMLLIAEAIDSGRTALSDTVTASARAASFGGSCVYLEEGELMTVSDMLKCIAVVSANDCAVAMAEHIAGSEELFVEKMNEKAAELGLTNTHFTNCTGLFEDSDHYTSARDLAIVSRELMKHEFIKDYTTIWMDSVRNGEFQLSNTNKLVYWYKGCTGLKTGYTSSAMYCLSATAERDGVEYIAVIMHGDSSDSRNADAKALLNYAFANYTLCSLVPDEPLPEVNVEYGRRAGVAVSPVGDTQVLIRNGIGAPEYSIVLPETISAPITAGDKLGEIEVTINGEKYASVDLAAAESVEEIGFLGKLKYLTGNILGI